MRKKIKVLPSPPLPRCDLCGDVRYVVCERDLFDTMLGITQDRFNFIACSRCGLLRLWPRPTEDQLPHYYPAEYAPYQRSSALIMAINLIRWRMLERRIKRFLGGVGRLLEVGCGQGELLRFLSRRGWQAAGIEMDRQSAAIARQINGLGVSEGKFEDFLIPENIEFDCVVMRFVLEHLPSPKEGLRRAAALLGRGGIAVVSIPNFDSWERRVFGRWWHCYDVPRHFHIFTEETVRAYAAETGFRVEQVSYSWVPNDWIGSIARMLVEKGWRGFGALFTYKNPLLASLFLPLSAAGALARASSRFTCILQKV